MKIKGHFKFIFVFILLICISVPSAFSLWVFTNNDSSMTTSVNLLFDPVSSNVVEEDVQHESESAKKYDVYFMAQNLDIYNYLTEIPKPAGEELKGLAKKYYTFTDQSEGHGLYYLNTTEWFTEYRGELGAWREDDNFSTVPTASELFKKFPDCSYLDNGTLESIGHPRSKIADKTSKAGSIWDLKFINWTLDRIYLNYDVVYLRDGSTWNIVLDGAEQPTVFKEELTNKSIYYRQTYMTEINGYVQVTGTFPDEGFDIANLSTLFENYDEYAINIDGRECLFFYPIYSLGKDNVLGNRNLMSGKEVNLDTKDCIRSETDGLAESAKYFTYDCASTDAVRAQDGFEDIMVNWPGQNYPLYLKRYHCYQMSNHNVTEEMVTKNATAKTRSESISVGTNHTCNLSLQQCAQTKCGEYLYSDMSIIRSSWKGNNVYYFIDEDNELVDINFRAGLFDVYIFAKECLFDHPENSADRYYKDSTYAQACAFSATERATIDQIFQDENKHIAKTINCQVATKYIRHGGWNNEGRGYYIVIVENLPAPINVSSYGLSDAEGFNYNYAVNNHIAISNVFASDGTVAYNVDTVEAEITNLDALKDLDNNPISLIYPSYYFTNIIELGDSAVYQHNIGFGNNEPSYSVPTYNYFLSSNNAIQRVYQSTEQLEFMKDAVLSNVVERSRIKVRLADGTTIKTLEELKNDNATLPLYNSILLQLEEVYLMKVKESGSYRICVYRNIDENNEVCFDVWAARPSGNQVIIVDSADLVNGQLEYDIDGVLISIDWLLDHNTYMCWINYDDDVDLLSNSDFDLEITAPNSVKYIFNETKILPSDLIASATEMEDTYLIPILNILEYIDNYDKCLYDVATGRYITYVNVFTNPYQVTKDCLLLIVDKPQAFA